MSEANLIQAQIPKTRRWILLAAAVLFTGSIAWVIVQQSNSAEAQENQVQILDGDSEYHYLPLSQDGEYSFTSSRGTNTIRIADGKVSMVEATCPNQDCVHIGEIHNGADIIVCLPNQCVVSIVTPDGERVSAVDSVAS